MSAQLTQDTNLTLNKLGTTSYSTGDFLSTNSTTYQGVNQLQGLSIPAVTTNLFYKVLLTLSNPSALTINDVKLALIDTSIKNTTFSPILSSTIFGCEIIDAVASAATSIVVSAYVVCGINTSTIATLLQPTESILLTTGPQGRAAAPIILAGAIPIEMACIIPPFIAPYLQFNTSANFLSNGGTLNASIDVYSLTVNL